MLCGAGAIRNGCTALQETGGSVLRRVRKHREVRGTIGEKRFCEVLTECRVYAT